MYWGNPRNVERHLKNLLAQHAFLANPEERCPYPPMTIDIEATNACNLRCISCFHSHESFRAQAPMSMETFKTVLEQADGHCDRITFGNHGENMMHSRFLEMVELAKTKGFFINLITNATLLDERRADALIDLGLDRIVFSLDSMDREVYESIRVGAKFESVLKNVLYFVARNAKQGFPVYVNISTVNTTQALKSRPTVFEYFEDLPIHGVFTSDLLNFHGVAESIDEQTKFTRLYKDTPQTEWPMCMNAWDRLLVRPNGDCTPCAIDWNYVYCLGNVNEHPIMDLWNNEKARAYRRAHINRDYRAIEQNGVLCSQCDGKFGNSVEILRRRIEASLGRAMVTDSVQAKTMENAGEKIQVAEDRLSSHVQHIGPRR